LQITRVSAIIGITHNDNNSNNSRNRITNDGDLETTTKIITIGITHSDIMIRSLTVISYSWQSLIFKIT
jgi:hypothetical protein